jgi:hypothetical protein
LRLIAKIEFAKLASEQFAVQFFSGLLKQLMEVDDAASGGWIHGRNMTQGAVRWRLLPRMPGLSSSNLYPKIETLRGTGHGSGNFRAGLFLLPELVLPLFWDKFFMYPQF